METVEQHLGNLEDSSACKQLSRQALESEHDP